jgi:hypothetical protein
MSRNNLETYELLFKTSKGVFVYKNMFLNAPSKITYKSETNKLKYE